MAGVIALRSQRWIGTGARADRGNDTAEAAAAARGRRSAAAAVGLLSLCALLPPASAAPAAETWQLRSRPGVTQPVLVEAPASAKAAVVLYAGGNGGVTFSNDDVAGFRGNFLLRSRDEFRKHGLVVATFGAPSDRQSGSYLDDAFRLSAEHAADTRAVVEALREKYKVPVWLVGTSRGTFSAAAAALQLGKAVDGVVLTATMASVVDLSVDRFEVPVLMAHHGWDSCRSTYFRDARRTFEKLKAPRRQLLEFSGGNNDGPPCEARGYHGFNGIEAEVIAAIVRWMLAP